MLKLAISIVLYSPDRSLLKKVVDALLQACLQLASAGTCTSVLDLINNNPDEISLDEIAKIAQAASMPQFVVELVESGVNGGYGAGNNVSIRRHLDADFHLVLNPDVLVAPDALIRAINYMIANSKVGLLTPQVRGFDNSIQYLCKRPPTLLDMFIRSASSRLLNRIFAERNFRYEMREYDYGQVICPVPYPTGCFMLFRRSVLNQIVGFDEGFFLHYEDADIGRRVAQVSLTVYVPDVVVLHKWSRDSHKSWHMRWITIKSGLRYWYKWGGVL
jgi:GT2 family glycosyltransferase